jgi:hypothetical protein
MGGVQTLGDAWGGEPQPASDSVFSLDFARNKVREFQSVLNALDLGYQSIVATLQSPATPDDLRADLQLQADEFQSKKWGLKACAEALNMGAAAVNAAGGRMPQLSIPGTLGIAPLALPFAFVAAIATSATLMVWGREWLRGVNDRMKTAQLLDAQATPEARQELARSIAQTDAAIAQAESSGFAALAPIIKWVAIGVGAFMLYRAVAPMLKR